MGKVVIRMPQIISVKMLLVAAMRAKRLCVCMCVVACLTLVSVCALFSRLAVHPTTNRKNALQWPNMHAPVLATMQRAAAAKWQMASVRSDKSRDNVI